MAATAAAMSFEENMTAFYMAFAEQALEPMCQALSNMRLVVQSDRVEKDTSAPHEQQDADVREEVRHNTRALSCLLLLLCEKHIRWLTTCARRR